MFVGRRKLIFMLYNSVFYFHVALLNETNVMYPCTLITSSIIVVTMDRMKAVLMMM